jgi:hypothetical protein
VRYLFAIILLSVFAGTGCGPIVSGVQIVNANIALSSAATAGAKRAAVYEYTAAKEYLQKAREEHAYSDFWAARIYADKALDYAVRARNKSSATGGEPSSVILPEAPPPPESTSTEEILIVPTN